MLKSAKEIVGTDFAFIGGKAKGLLWLHKQGYPVPDFSVFTSQTVAMWLQQAGILDTKDFSEHQEALRFEIKKVCRSLPISTWQSVAVRSSGLAEDGDQDSFAGIHESVLNVNGLDQAIEAIFKVIQSAFSDVAIRYRLSRGLKTTQIEIAVLIQKMVPATSAGVAFGLDLQSGSRKSTWISLTDGLGDKLVSGEVDGCEVLCEAENFKVVRGQLGKIPKRELLKLANITQEISRLKRHPQDIEWAFDGRNMWLTQVRPVTTEVLENNLPKTVFDNSNIQESYCGVTTPLTFTYASRAYFLVYRQLMKLMHMSDDEIQKATWNLSNMLGLVDGRVYYNINNWYAGLLYLPSFGKRKEDMENMMGLEKPVDFVQGHNLSFREKLMRIPRMSKLLAVMIYRFARMDRLIREFDHWFWGLYHEADIETLYQLNEQEIFDKIRVFQDLFLEKWGIPVLNDTKVMLEMGSVKRSLAKYGLQDEIQSLIYGAEVESIRPSLEIHRLSKTFGDRADLTTLLMQKRGRELEAELELFFPEAFAQVRQFISLYGDRTMGELKLETITSRQDSEQLFTLIRSYIESGLHLKASLFEDHSLKSSELLNKVPRLPRFFLSRKIHKLKRSMAAREKMRMHRTRNFGLMRELYLALGKKWATRQLISETRDIFYLTHQEIFEIGSGRSSTMSLKQLVELRKKDFQAAEAKYVPNQVSISFPPSFQQTPFSIQTFSQESQFKGLGCSQGVCEGEVLLVRDPSDIQGLSGKILLAERTDPGWTPLFAMIQGVIIEKGSMLSHSAVIAREMGIPAVLGIPSVTRQIQSGDIVRLDGVHGTVEIIKRKENSAISDADAGVSL